MRKFQVTVNGQTYIVDVEELAAGAPTAFVAPAAVAAPAAPAPVAAAPAAAPAPVAAPAPAATPVGKAPAGSETVNSPMPGTILKVMVAQGEKVTKGQNLMILEAMKMENEIKSPRDGVVAAVLVSQGATVNPGEGLIAIS